MVSGVDFPLNQSIELIVQNILKPTRRKSKNVCISGESETSGGSVERLAVWLNGTLGLGRVRAQQVRHPTHPIHPSLSQRCLESAREFEAHLQFRGAVTRGGSSGANRWDAATADAANAAASAASRSPSASSEGCEGAKGAIRNRKPNARHATWVTWAHGDGCGEEYSASLQPRHVYGPGQETWIWGSLQPSLLAMELQWPWHQQGLGLCELHPSRWCSTISEGHGGEVLWRWRTHGLPPRLAHWNWTCRCPGPQVQRSPLQQKIPQSSMVVAHKANGAIVGDWTMGWNSQTPQGWRPSWSPGESRLSAGRHYVELLLVNVAVWSCFAASEAPDIVWMEEILHQLVTIGNYKTL